ncbi:NAD-dependent epimerase/dehydratase family protein [Pontibacter sp. CAU 1760]
MRILIIGGSGFIGTNLVEECLDKGISLLNADWNPPLNPMHASSWVECDIMDKDALQKVFSTFQPTEVVHLAARTDTDIYDLNGDLNEYAQNVEGNKNVLDCIKNTPGIERVIMTSTMFVCEAGYMPKHDQDFKPFTLYGVSKMIGENDTRKAKLNCTWTIIRPQTIWGPWCMRYRDTMFKVMRKGLYIHPSKKNVQRSYGYVGNVVWQIQQILSAPAEKVHQQVLYVGDEPINLLNWVKCVSRELTGKQVRVFPTSFVKAIALTGDLLKKVKVTLPLTSTRYDSMTQDYLTPIGKTYNILGRPPYSMEEGVKKIIDWYRNESADVRHPAKKIVKKLNVKVGRVAELS